MKDIESNNNNNVELTNHNIPVLTQVKIYERLGGGNFGDVYRGEWKVLANYLNFILILRERK